MAGVSGTKSRRSTACFAACGPRLPRFRATPTNTIIRTNEAEADIYGLNAAREPDGFAMVALSSRIPQTRSRPWEEFFFYDHPSGRERFAWQCSGRQSIRTRAPAEPEVERTDIACAVSPLLVRGEPKWISYCTAKVAAGRPPRRGCLAGSATIRSSGPPAAREYESSPGVVRGFAARVHRFRSRRQVAGPNAPASRCVR